MTNMFFASIAQAAPAAKVGVKTGIFDSVMDAGPAVQLLLLLMVVLSVISWAIIFTKHRQYSALRSANEKFNDRFWKANSLETLFERVNEDAESNEARVFKAAYLELQRLADASGPGKQVSQMAGGGIENLERTVRKAIDGEVAAAESRLGFLATTGSTAPFIGLLGTVIGIMTSFSHIAASGSASLAVVAPGISEALFSTAVGLFAALPAVAGYNYFVGQLRKLEMDLNSFGTDFLNIAKRNFFRDA